MFQLSDLFQDADEDKGIQFFSEDVSFDLEDPPRIQQWISQVVALEKKQLQLINYVFCSDTYLHHLNVEYLDHDTLTDIITFQYSPLPTVEGDIFISIDRIRENAAAFGVTFLQELYRVMVHGALHLCGYGDKTPEEKKIMTQKENEALAMLKKEV